MVRWRRVSKTSTRTTAVSTQKNHGYRISVKDIIYESLLQQGQSITANSYCKEIDSILEKFKTESRWPDSTPLTIGLHTSRFKSGTALVIRFWGIQLIHQPSLPQIIIYFNTFSFPYTKEDSVIVKK